MKTKDTESYILQYFTLSFINTFTIHTLFSWIRAQLEAINKGFLNNSINQLCQLYDIES